MIIHISGSSGSGKTTLGNRLKKLKNVVVIDTDDIDDPNSMKIINKYNLDSKQDENKFNKELKKLNKVSLDKILNDNKSKNIIFVGFFHSGMNYMFKKVNSGYHIKITPDILFRQYNKRTLNVMHTNYKEIYNLFESKFYEKKIHYILSKKFGIRNGFDCADIDDFKKDIRRGYLRAKKDKYKYKNTDDIYNDICNDIEL
jgi:adenylate kinase family enzyme